MIRKLSLTSLVTLVLLAAASCATPTQADKELQKRNEEVAALAKKREARAAELASMSVGQLADELKKDSNRGVEPFNSMAYRELTSRGSEVGDDLKSRIKPGDRSAFLGLLALRQVAPRRYREVDVAQRARLLVESLQKSKYFNAWGLPHRYWEDAAKALVETGEAAEPLLRALLQDVRPAPMWGSEEVLEYQRYKYRVCDYAWALLSAIRGEKIEIPTDPAARDKLFPK